MNRKNGLSKDTRLYVYTFQSVDLGSSTVTWIEKEGRARTLDARDETREKRTGSTEGEETLQDLGEWVVSTGRTLFMVN